MKIILSLFVLVLISSCTKDKVAIVPVDVCKDTVSYGSVIAPLMNTSCNTSGCHNATDQAGGRVFVTHAQVAAAADILLASVRPGYALQMPQGQALLADSVVQKIQCWITQGKLNN